MRYLIITQISNMGVVLLVVVMVVVMVVVTSAIDGGGDSQRLSQACVIAL